MLGREVDNRIAMRLQECIEPDHERAGPLADGRLEGAAKIFRLVFAKPAFANLNVGIACFLGLDLEPEMIRCYVIVDERSLLFGCFEQDLDALQIADGGLGIDVEFPKRFDVVAKVFDSNRTRRLPGKQIDDAAADGELAARRNL